MSDDKSVTFELLEDCLRRIAAGEQAALFDLALTWIGHIAERDPDVVLAVAEGMLLQAAQSSVEAKDYLATTWPDLKPILHKRIRRG